MTTPDSDGEEAPRPTRRAWRNLGRVWSGLEPYLAGNWLRVLVFVGTSTAAGVAEALLLFAIVRLAIAIAGGEAVVTVAASPFPQLETTIGGMFGGTLVVLAALAVLTVGTSYLAARMSTIALLTARTRTFDAFLDATWDLQARERDGHLQELLTTHAKKVAQGSLVLSDGATAALGFVALLAAALFISPVAAGTILLGVTGLYFVLRPVTRSTRRTSQAHVGANATFALSVTEAAASAREVRAFDASDVVREAVHRQAVEAGRMAFATRFLTRVTPSLYQVAGLLLIVAGMAGAWALEVGDLTALGAVILLLVRALTKSQHLQSAIQQASEVAPYLESLTAEQARYRAARVTFGTRPLGPVEAIEVVDVSMEYEPGRPVLRDVSFAVRRGERIGIVGPSGSGKSTLVQLLLRLRPPAHGAFLVNGRSADVYDPASWAAAVAFVPQDNHLLHATVADNVRFHRRSVDDDAVERACRAAHLHDDIVALPAGYATIVGAGGHGLSGGQRQRLGLARALAGSPSVVVLDEPTSALDLRSESLIQSTLDQLHGSLTLFIVAHRLSTIQSCDRIMVLEEGRLMGFDAPADLARSNGFFRDATRLSQLR